MIHGRVTQNRPYITLIVGGKDNTQQIPAVIDTGFTGQLKIPLILVRDLNLQLTHTESVKVADGRSTNMSACLVNVSLEGRIDSINAIVSPGEVLAGMGLLKKFRYILEIDFPKNKLKLFKEGEIV